MEDYVITISDDIDIFKTKAIAEKYLEPWILENKFKAFKTDGTALLPDLEAKEKRFVIFNIKSVKLNETHLKKPEELRNELITYLGRLKKSNVEEEKNLDLQSLVQKLIELKGFTK